MSNKYVIRRKLYKKYNGKCFYCGREVELTYDKPNSAVIEHVIPKSRGGASNYSNYVLACSKCNMLKGTLTLKEFYRKLVLLILEAEETILYYKETCKRINKSIDEVKEKIRYYKSILAYAEKRRKTEKNEIESRFKIP